MWMEKSERRQKKAVSWIWGETWTNPRTRFRSGSAPARGDRSDVHYDRDERRGEDDGEHEQRRARVREEGVPARASLLRAGPMSILRGQLLLAAGLGVRGSLPGKALALAQRASGLHGVVDERLAIATMAESVRGARSPEIVATNTSRTSWTSGLGIYRVSTRLNDQLVVWWLVVPSLARAELHGRSSVRSRTFFLYGLSGEKSALTRSVKMKQKISDGPRRLRRSSVIARVRLGRGEERRENRTGRSGSPSRSHLRLGARIDRSRTHRTRRRAIRERRRRSSFDKVYNWGRRRANGRWEARTRGSRGNNPRETLWRCRGCARCARGRRYFIATCETHPRARFRRGRAALYFLLRRFGDARVLPSSDPRPPDSRAPPSSFSSPTAAVGAEHGASRGASREFRVSRSIAAPRAASPPHPRTPSADADIFSAEDSTCANARLRFLSDGSLPTSAVLARARGGHHPRRRVHQAGHGVRRRPARHRRAAQGTSIRRRRADPRPPRARQTPRLRRKRSGCPGDRKTTIRRRRCGGSPRIFSRTKRFLARSVFSSEEEETHLASSSPSPQPRPPLIRGSDAAGARSPTPPSARGPPRVSGLRTDRDPPRAPPVSVASLSEPRTRGSSRERRGFSLSRSVDPSDPTRPIRRRARD